MLKIINSPILSKFLKHHYKTFFEHEQTGRASPSSLTGAASVTTVGTILLPCFLCRQKEHEDQCLVFWDQANRAQIALKTTTTQCRSYDLSILNFLITCKVHDIQLHGERENINHEIDLDINDVFRFFKKTKGSKQIKLIHDSLIRLSSLTIEIFHKDEKRHINLIDILEKDKNKLKIRLAPWLINDIYLKKVISWTETNTRPIKIMMHQVALALVNEKHNFFFFNKISLQDLYQSFQPTINFRTFKFQLKRICEEDHSERHYFLLSRNYANKSEVLYILSKIKLLKKIRLLSKERRLKKDFSVALSNGTGSEELLKIISTAFKDKAFIPPKEIEIIQNKIEDQNYYNFLRNEWGMPEQDNVPKREVEQLKKYQVSIEKLLQAKKK